MELKSKIRLKLTSYDSQLVDKAAKQITLTGKRTGAEVVGPVPLPNRTQRWTVNRSPHVDKKAKDQFQLVTHQRLLEIWEPSEQTMDALMKLSISAGVDVKIG